MEIHHVYDVRFPWKFWGWVLLTAFAIGLSIGTGIALWTLAVRGLL